MVTSLEWVKAKGPGCSSVSDDMILRPVVVWLLPRTLVEPRDLREEELLDELGLETLSVALGLFSFLFAVILTACITGRLGASLSRPLPFAALDPKDVGREGVDALDAFFALGTVFGVTTEVGLALSSSVELSIDCIATSSAVDSPAAGAATAPPKVQCRILTRPRIHR